MLALLVDLGEHQVMLISSAAAVATATQGADVPMAALGISGDPGDRVLFAIVFGLLACCCLFLTVALWRVEAFALSDLEDMSFVTVLGILPTLGFGSFALDAGTGPRLDGIAGYGIGILLVGVAAYILVIGIVLWSEWTTSVGMFLGAAVCLASDLFLGAGGIGLIFTDGTITPDDISRVPVFM